MDDGDPCGGALSVVESAMVHGWVDGEAISHGNVSDGDNPEIPLAVADLAEVARGEVLGVGNIHEVQVALSLWFGDPGIVELDGPIDGFEVLADIGDPVDLEMG